MSQEPTYVGIDVSKESVDVAVRPTGRSWSVSYDGAGVDDLVAQLIDLKPAGVITESTGGLELPLVAALGAAALPVAVVNPARYGTSPSRQDVWLRPTDWTLRFWRIPGRQCVHRYVPCGTKTHRCSGPF